MNAVTRLPGLIVVSLAAGALSACGPAPASEPQARSPIPVTTVPAAVVDTTEQLEAGGTVAAQESALVSSRIVATILTVPVRAGDRVRAGDVLVTLDARDVTDQARQARAAALAAEKALTQARAEQSAMEAEHRLATSWHSRITALHDRTSATDQERDEADARLATALARVAAAQAAIETADANLASARAAAAAAATTESFTVLRAPFDGLVTERLSDPGNLAAPAVPLLRIESDGVRQVVVRVDEARAAYVNPGDRVQVAIDALDERDEDDNVLEGVVSELARAIGADERAFTVKVTLPPTVTVRTGSFARVLFRGAPRRAVRVPAAAIRRNGQLTSVFVVQDGVARLRLVQAGLAAANGVEVLAGLDGGEVIVTPPPPGLVDGMPVAIGGAGTLTGVAP